MSECGPQRCLVYCRVRPSKGEECKEESLLELEKTAVIVNRNNKTYEFDGTLRANSTQSEVFDMIAKPCVHHCLNGYCSALMAYGQTGTGKSFTMCCMKPGEEGIVPRAAQMIFEEIQKNANKTWNVHMQFIQIYRDNLGDLMTESGKDRVDIIFDKETGVTLPGCSVHEVKTVDEFMHVYNVGDSRRVTAATAMNPESSRGHTALVVWITAVSNDMAETETRGKITFIDLAGYERFSKTGISADNPVMRDEAKTINASLLSLGHVVSSLSNGDSHVPWRNSKLTRLLQDSIGGRSRTTIILTVGPSPNHVFETTNTLQFGQRAMAVKVQAKTTETVNYKQLSIKLQSILNEKEERINALELQAASHEMVKEELQAHHQRDIEQLRSFHLKEIEKVKNEGVSDEKIMDLIKQQEIETENLIDQQREEILYTVEKHEEDNKGILEKLDDDHEKQLAVLHLRIRDLELELNEKNLEILAMEPQVKDDGDSSDTSPQTNSPTGVKTSSSPPSSPCNPPNVTKLCLSNVNDELTQKSSYMDDNLGDLSNEDLKSIINDLEIKSEKDRQLTISLQVELDRTMKLCQERSEDLLEMESYVSDLRAKYAAENNGDSCPLTDDNLSGVTFADLIQKKTPKAATVKMVDAKLLEQAMKKYRDEVRDKDEELETLRKSMLELEMQQISGGAGADENNPPMTARGFYPMTSRINMTARGMRTSRLSCENSDVFTPQMTSRNPAQGPESVSTHHLRLQVDLLRGQLEEAHQEISELRVALNANNEVGACVKNAIDEELKIKYQKELLHQFFRDDGSVTFVEWLAENAKKTARELETQLNKKNSEVTKLQVSLEILRRQLRDAGITPEMDTRKTKRGILPNQVEVLLDNGDYNNITSCKEAELRQVYKRLFQREKTLFVLNNENKRVVDYLMDLRKRIAAEVPEFTVPAFEFKTLDQLLSGLSEGHISGTCSASHPCDVSRSQLDSLLSLIKALRNQNSVTQSLVYERSINLKHYVWLAIDNKLVSPDFEMKGIVGDVASEIREAFAERDEEVFNKDHVLLQRCTEVAALEEGMVQLHSQLVDCGHTPCRPVSKSSAFAIKTRQQVSNELEQRKQAVHRLQLRDASVKSDLTNIIRQIEEAGKEDAKNDNSTPISSTRESKIDLLRLRSKQEKLENTIALIYAQLSAQEMEIEFLNRVKESSGIFVEHQDEMKLNLQLDAAEKLRTKYSEKKKEKKKLK